jgi:hypothetical protein
MIIVSFDGPTGRRRSIVKKLVVCAVMVLASASLRAQDFKAYQKANNRRVEFTRIG